MYEEKIKNIAESGLEENCRIMRENSNFGETVKLENCKIMNFTQLQIFLWTGDHALDSKKSYD